jgi:hypothetical protein
MSPTFLPTADIFETEDALTVVLEIPGVDRNNIDVNVENGILMIKAGSTLASTRACSRSIVNTISVHSGGVLEFRARLITPRSKLRCVMALSRCATKGRASQAASHRGENGLSGRAIENPGIASWRGRNGRHRQYGPLTRLLLSCWEGRLRQAVFFLAEQRCSRPWRS